MATLTIGEAKSQLVLCRNTLRALTERVAELNQDRVVIDLSVATRPGGPIPPPPVFSPCAAPERPYLTVGDYVAGFRGMSEWLRDFIESLDAPDGRPFAGGELPRE